MNKKVLIIIAMATVVGASAIFSMKSKKDNDLPVVAIVSYGPIPPMEASIKGIKEQLADYGFIQGKTIEYEIADIGFDHALIPQVITNINNKKPKILVVMATPIAQFAKRKIHDIPIVYNVITDPVDAGLIKNKNQSEGNITGSSDMQDLGAMLNFAKSILPHTKTVGLLYETSDSNDLTLVNMMKVAASFAGMSVIAIPIDQIRDIPVRIQGLKGKADFLYVGASGIQAALPIIASETQKMNIPVFNMEEQAVRDGLVLASFGVNYESVGKNAAKLISQILNGSDISTVNPIYPTLQDHMCVINKKQAEKFKIAIPENAEVVE